jgi:hypothetical protein
MLVTPLIAASGRGKEGQLQLMKAASVDYSRFSAHGQLRKKRMTFQDKLLLSAFQRTSYVGNELLLPYYWRLGLTLIPKKEPTATHFRLQPRMAT